MNRRLRMNHHFNLLRPHAKEPVRLDDLEAFVHHRRGINGDAIAHAPVRMRERLLWRDTLQRRQRRFAKRSTRSGQHQPPHLSMLPAPQTLVDRVVPTRPLCERRRPTRVRAGAARSAQSTLRDSSRPPAPPPRIAPATIPPPKDTAGQWSQWNREWLIW